MHLKTRPIVAMIALSVLLAACSVTIVATPAGSTDRPALDSPDPSVVASAIPPSPEPTPAEAPSDPTPLCPAPPAAAKPPNVVASIAEGNSIPATLGSYTLTTCSTVASVDGPPLMAAPQALAAHMGDMLWLTLPSDWRFFRWEGIDDTHLDGGVMFEPTDLPDRPQQIEVPISALGNRAGIYSLSIVSLDGKVVGRIEVRVAVRVT